MDAKRNEGTASSAPDCAVRNGAHTGWWEEGRNTGSLDAYFGHKSPCPFNTQAAVADWREGYAAAIAKAEGR